MKKILRNIVSALGGGLLSSRRLEQLELLELDVDKLFELSLKAVSDKCESKAQLKQDIIVLLTKRFKMKGFFVEFGATNGVDLSNTYLLEKSFGWNGILAEPATIWHESLSKNRNVNIDFSCVYGKSGEVLAFNMADEAELSTIAHFGNEDIHSNTRKNGLIYNVNTISLNDLLCKYDAPYEIDYLSIDTEGSEFEILSNFDFDKYNISIITCEHNYTEDRKKIYDLLIKNGYVRKYEGLSKWDDWYFRD